MNEREKIESVLAQENYKVENGKIFRLDNFGEWCEQKVNAKDQIQLRDATGNVELFDWKLVQSVMRGEEINVLPITEKAYEGLVENRIEKDEISQFGKPLKGDAQKILNDTYKKSLKRGRHITSPQIGGIHSELPKRTTIGNAEIKVIRKMLADKKSINKIAEAIGSNRFAVSYIVKQIKAGNKLKNEK